MGAAAAGADVAAGGFGVGDGVGVGVGVDAAGVQPGALGKSAHPVSVMAPTISPRSRLSTVTALSPRGPSAGRRIVCFQMPVVLSSGQGVKSWPFQMPRMRERGRCAERQKDRKTESCVSQSRKSEDFGSECTKKHRGEQNH